MKWSIWVRVYDCNSQSGSAKVNGTHHGEIILCTAYALKLCNLLLSFFLTDFKSQFENINQKKVNITFFILLVTSQAMSYIYRNFSYRKTFDESHANDRKTCFENKIIIFWQHDLSSVIALAYIQKPDFVV